MPFVIGGKGGGSGGSATVPSDLVFSGANKAACEAARDAYFTTFPAKKVNGVTVLLDVTGDVDALQQWTGTSWTDVTALIRGPKGDTGDEASNLITSVAGRQGAVVLTKNDVGLTAVDNTSDNNKPVSGPQQTALNAKADAVHTHSSGDVIGLATSLATKQDTLVSGTNVKTVNGNSLLGSGNIVIDAVPDATTGQKGSVQLAGDLAGTATAPTVVKVNGVSVSNSGVAAGKVLKASSGSAASFESLTAADVSAIPTSAKAVANGVAELDENGKLPSARLPSGIVQTVNGLTGTVVITKSDLGLAQVNNTADADKPISSAAQTALNLKLNADLLGADNGACELDDNGKIPSSRISALPTGETFTVANLAARLALSTAVKGDVAIQLDTEESFRLKTTPANVAGNWAKLLFPASVQSVNTKTGAVTLTKADLSLGNVDNTADSSKPISTATQAALDGKVDKTALSTKGSLLSHTGSALTSHAVGTDGQILKSDSTSPTGLKWEALPSALIINNTLTSDSTTESLSAAAGKALKTLVDAKPALASLSADKPVKAEATAAVGTSSLAARADHVHPETGIAVTNFTELGQMLVGTGAAAYGQVNLGAAGQVLTVDPTSIHTGVSWKTLTNATSLADGLMSSAHYSKLEGLSNTTVNNTLTSTSTTQALSANQGKLLNDAVVLKANIASPTFTGAPAAPTAAADTNTTQLATTAFVLGQAGAAPSNTANTAAAGSSLKYARQDHVHRHPDSLHNGTRKVAQFTGTEYYIESPTASKTRVLLKDDSINLVVNNLSRFWADGSWSITRGPAGTDADSHKLHMSNTETVLHAKGAKIRAAIYEGETILRGPTATDAGSTFLRLYDDDISLYRKGQYRLGVDASNTWAHSPDASWRTWLFNTGFIVNRDGTGDMLLMSSTSSSVRFSWGTITSDQRLKTNLNTLSDELLDAWGECVTWGSYNWLEKDPEKADQKTQVGLIAQDVIKAFEVAGVDWTQWKVVEYVEAEDRYGVCYDHCNAIENAYQRRRLDRIEKALGL